MLPFHVLDVFTRRAYAGNPLAVVLQAGGLSDSQMQAIAREFNLSETIFVRPPADPAHTVAVRIFTPQAELPFAGHPTIGCAILLADRATDAGTADTVITFEQAAGLVAVTVTRTDGATVAELTAPVIPHPHPGLAEPERIAAALGLPLAALDLPGHRPGFFAGGPAFLFVPLVNATALAMARPHEPHWSALVQPVPTGAAYLYTPGNGTDWQARLFAPGSGIAEDPATGSATAILAAQLLACNALPDGTSRHTILQGAEMGRPSDLLMTADVAGGRLMAVRVAGSAVRIAEGRIAPP